MSELTTSKNLEELSLEKGPDSNPRTDLKQEATDKDCSKGEPNDCSESEPGKNGSEGEPGKNSSEGEPAVKTPTGVALTGESPTWSFSHLRPTSFLPFLITFTFLLINTMLFFIIHSAFVLRRFQEKLGVLVIFPSLIALTVFISSLPNLPLPRLRHKINSLYPRESQLKRYIAYTSSWIGLAALYWLFLYLTDYKRSLLFQEELDLPQAFVLISRYADYVRLSWHDELLGIRWN